MGQASILGCLPGGRSGHIGFPEVQAVFNRQYRLPAHKLAVVDNGIDLAPFLEVPPRSHDGALIFGSVGRLVPVKDYANLLNAFAIVHRHHPMTRLRILGGGPCEGELRSLAETLGISQRVEFCGFSRDVSGFLSEIDVYVSSSLSEGLPVSMLEAIAAGIPVVATAVGGVVGVARRTGSGRLCPSGESAALARAMEAAMETPNRLADASRARALVRQWYSAERMTDKYERIYQGLLGSDVRTALETPVEQAFKER